MRAASNAGDIYDQISILEPWWKAFPSATIVFEKNAQQWVFSDVAATSMPNAVFEPHYTKTSTDKDEDVGIPSVLQLAKGQNNHLHLPYGDEESRAMSDILLAEIRGWPGLHGHCLPAIWFTRTYDAQGKVIRPTRQQSNEASDYRMLKVTPRMRQTARAAWRPPS